jgi:H/ACA ribonucleoprotein complex subunit 4
MPSVPEKLVVKAEEPTDESYGSDPRKRPIPVLLNYGLIPLDKTRGPTSHEVVSWVRRILELEKAGHSGTLDPAVSGLLPIGLGRATKALGLLLLFPKEYIAVMRIHSSVPREKVDSVIREFTGEIYQRPPQRSSVRRDVRSRRIYELEVLEQEGNLYLLRCLCEAGTYIRKLIYDIGELLQVGATMVELRRTKVGPLSEGDGLVTLHALSDALYQYKSNGAETQLRKAILPIEECLGGIKRVSIKDSAVDAVCHGAMLAVPGILSISPGITKEETTLLLTAKGELVGIGKAKMTTEEVLKAEKGIAFSIDRVIMDQGTYPKLWRKGGAVSAEEKQEEAPVAKS